jgi:polyisoprenoid-binding protein YceI
MGLTVSARKPEPKTAAYKVSQELSTAKWHAAKVTGEHNGTLQFAGGSVNVSGNSIVGGLLNMDMETIDNTDLDGEWKEKLVRHLKSDDFFSVEAFPVSTLKIRRAQQIPGAKPGTNNYNITADLTIKGITNEISFPAMIVITPTQVIANADFNVDRTKYDIRYGSKSFFQGIGDKAIHDEFNIKVRVVAVK